MRRRGTIAPFSSVGKHLCAEFALETARSRCDERPALRPLAWRAPPPTVLAHGEARPMIEDGSTSAPPQLFGHPRALWVLAGTELWDRISFHGMQALLVLYMVGQLLLPGHVEHIVGFAGFR